MPQAYSELTLVYHSDSGCSLCSHTETYIWGRQHILQSHPHSEAQDVSLACIKCRGNTLLTKP